MIKDGSRVDPVELVIKNGYFPYFQTNYQRIFFQMFYFVQTCQWDASGKIWTPDSASVLGACECNDFSSFPSEFTDNFIILFSGKECVQPEYPPKEKYLELVDWDGEPVAVGQVGVML